MFRPKTILGTTVKLNGSNYLLWARLYIFISAQNKLTHLLESPPAATNPTYTMSLSEDYCVMTWLASNSLKKKISGSVMFLTIVKKMWDTMMIMGMRRILRGYLRFTSTHLRGT